MSNKKESLPLLLPLKIIFLNNIYINHLKCTLLFGKSNRKKENKDQKLQK